MRLVIVSVIAKAIVIRNAEFVASSTSLGHSDGEFVCCAVKVLARIASPVALDRSTITRVSSPGSVMRCEGNGQSRVGQTPDGGAGSQSFNRDGHVTTDRM